jgi:hypothetical protein
MTGIRTSLRSLLWLGFPGAAASVQAQNSEPMLPPSASPDNELFLWLGLGCFAAVAGFLFGRSLLSGLRRRRRGRAVRMVTAEPSSRRQRRSVRKWFRRDPTPRLVPMEGLEARTRRAELKAEQATAVLRSELTPHLARLMKDRLIWTLMNQRARLLSANQANAEKVATLEHRLTAIQLQIRKQAAAYESRIAELEKDLAQKSTVTRELLKFRVILAKQALEAVRLEKNPAPFKR